MGPTLNTAAQMPAYALADRGTWISFQDRGDLEVLVEGDDRLFNQYGVILVNPGVTSTSRPRKVRPSSTGWFPRKGREAIGSYQLNGQQLFYPNAK